DRVGPRTPPTWGGPPELAVQFDMCTPEELLALSSVLSPGSAGRSSHRGTRNGSRPEPGPARIVRSGGSAGFECLDDLGQHLVDVTHGAEIGDAEARRLGILVGRDGVLRSLDADHVVGG